MMHWEISCLVSCSLGGGHPQRWCKEWSSLRDNMREQFLLNHSFLDRLSNGPKFSLDKDKRSKPNYFQSAGWGDAGDRPWSHTTSPGVWTTAPQLCSQQPGATHALLKEEGSSGCPVAAMTSLGNAECPLNLFHPGPEIPFPSLQIYPVDLFVSTLAPPFHILYAHTGLTWGSMCSLLVQCMNHSYGDIRLNLAYYVVFWVCFQPMGSAPIDIFHAPI